MCGRFTLRKPARELATFFDIAGIPDLTPRYNIAPTQMVAAVRMDAKNEQRELVLLHWGLIPSWSKDHKIGNRLINARAETVASKPSFRAAFKRRRCLIVTDGFYEWQKTDGPKQPFRIHMQDDRPFAFAGPWEHWKSDEQTIESCTIITTDANELMQSIHDRMPVILSPDDCGVWLDPEFEDKHKLQEMLKPYSGNDLEAYPVSTIVNSPKNDVEECTQSQKTY